MKEKLQLKSLLKNPQRSITFALIVLFIVMISWITLKTGPVVMTRFNTDPLSFLSGGWRVIQGQVPHRDFHLITGLLFYLLLAFSMIISGFSFKAFTVMNVILFILLTSWAWFIASRRMKPLYALLASVVVGLAIAGTYHLGFSLNTVTYANLYNRYAYGVFFIILIEQLFIPEKKQELDEIAGGFSTGFLLSALFFLKLTYFCTGVIIIVFRVLLIDFSKKWLFSMLVGAITLALPIFIYLKCDIIPMFNDYRTISRVRGTLILSTESVISNIVLHWKVFLLLLASWLLVPPFTITNRGKTITKLTLTALLIILLFSAVFLNLTNCGPDDIPLMALIAFIPIHFYNKNERSGGRTDWIGIALILLFFLTNWSYFVKNTGSIFYASSWKARVVNSLKLCDTPTLRDYYTSYYDGHGNNNYIEKVNEGLDILRKNMDREDRIVTLNFEDPFTIGLLLKSPRGDSITYHYTMNFNLKIYWDPDKLFSEATMVMVPKDDDPFAANPLRTIYSEYLLTHYDLKAESKRWLLLKRKQQ